MIALANAKPCPFADRHHHKKPRLAVAWSIAETETRVFCEDCWAKGPEARLGKRNGAVVDLESEAVELWNKRGFDRETASAVLNEVVKNCRRADDALRHPVDIAAELRRRIESGEWPKAGE